MYIIMYKYSALKINRKSFPNNIKNPIAPAQAEVARKESLAKDKGQKLTQSEQPRQTERQEVKQSRGMRR